MHWERSSSCSWSNKFHAPTVAQLRDGYAKPLVPVFEAARELLLGLEGVSESVVWHGVPWRWTLVYRCACRSQAERTRAFAYLIPDPTRLQGCVPLSREQIASMPMRRFKKTLRDTIIHARTVAGLSWPTWDLPTRAGVDELAELVRRKHRLLRGSDETVAMSA